MNNPIEVLNEAVILPELAPPKQGQLTRTVLRNHTTQRDVTSLGCNGTLRRGTQRALEISLKASSLRASLLLRPGVPSKPSRTETPGRVEGRNGDNAYLFRSQKKPNMSNFSAPARKEPPSSRVSNRIWYSSWSNRSTAALETNVMG